MKKFFDNPFVCFVIVCAYILAAIGAPAYLFYIHEGVIGWATIILAIMALPEFIRAIKAMTSNSGKKKEAEEKKK